MKLRSKVFAMTVACAFGLPASAQQGVTYTYNYDGPELQIYHDSANIVSVAPILVSRAIRVTKVTVNIEIDYPRSGDLNVFVYSPNLTRTKLIEKNCNTQATVANITFDDAAPRYSDVCPASAGTYSGNEPLANFNDQIAFGTWSLAVENNGSDSYIGYLRGFSLTVTGVPVTNRPVTAASAVVNEASLDAGHVTPGELVNILGANLGPTSAVFAPAGDLPTSLGGVQVTFGGTPAAISYASASVLKVLVPVSLTPGTRTDMHTSYQNTTSDVVSVEVLNAAPGVYTQSANGMGPLMVVNPDKSLNSPDHPAPKGQIVVFYATGLGAKTPSLATGQSPPMSPLSYTDFPVTAYVDGLPAEVIFAGSAPGYPGVDQVNLRIPPGAGSGARPIIVIAAGASSQSGVTIHLQ